MQKLLTPLFTTALILLLFACPAAADTVIIHTNDVHGHFSDSIGYDGLSAYIHDLKKAGDNVILLDAGDAFQGTAQDNLFKGESAVTIMNRLGYQAACVGNHEFDFGKEQLLNITNETEFPILVANILFEDTGKPAFQDSVILETAGLKIGVFGLTTPETKTKSMPANTEGLTFAEGEKLYEIAQNEVDTLKKAGCDIIICLAHLGLDDSSKPNRSCDLAEKVTGIDLLIDGHSHTVLENGKLVGNTLIVSTGCNLEHIGVVRMKDGKLNASLVTDYDKKDAEISALIKEYMDIVDTVYGKKIGETKVYLNGEKSPGGRTNETNLGDLVTDAILWKAEKLGCTPDIALTNGGSLRTSVQTGDITRKDIFNVLPYSNTLVTAEIPGKTLLEALEANSAATPEPEGGFAQVSGMVYCIDTSKEYKEGEINRVSIESVGGKPFDADKTYIVATNNFIASGGDKYAVFTGVAFKDTGVLVDDAVCDYIQEELKGVVDDQYKEPKGRIIVGDGACAKSAAKTPASPAPVFGVFAGLCAAAVLIMRR